MIGCKMSLFGGEGTWVFEDINEGFFSGLKILFFIIY